MTNGSHQDISNYGYNNNPNNPYGVGEYDLKDNGNDNDMGSDEDEGSENEMSEWRRIKKQIGGGSRNYNYGGYGGYGNNSSDDDVFQVDEYTYAYIYI